MSTAAVVLAAGFSRRLGRLKQLVELGGETLLQRAARVACEAGLSPVLVVVGPELVQHVPAECVVVLNHDAAEGMAASIRAGVARVALEGAMGVVVMACDQVGVTAEHLRALMAEPQRVTGSSYAGRVGVPAYFPREVFAELQKLEGDVGARTLLRGARTVVDERLALDIDTEEDLRRAVLEAS